MSNHENDKIRSGSIRKLNIFRPPTFPVLKMVLSAPELELVIGNDPDKHLSYNEVLGVGIRGAVHRVSPQSTK
jgi:hypothetical protein